MHKVIFPLCFIFISLFANAQYDENNYTLFTRFDGLSQDFVTGIVQDSAGYIWVATRKGLNRFDGKTFINYYKNTSDIHLPDNFINSLHIQNNNELTGSTAGGAFLFNTATHYYTQLIVPTDTSFFNWANWVFDAIKNRQGNCVVSSKTGLYIFNQAGKLICRYDHYLPAELGSKEMWFGGWLQRLVNGDVFQQNDLSGSVYRANNNKVDTFYGRNEFKKINYISPIKGGDSSSSFPGINNEIFIVNPTNSSIEVLSQTGKKRESCSLPKDIINDFDWHSHSFFLNDSTIALTSKIGGFYIFHYQFNEKKLSTNGKKYFASRYCTSILKDRDGRLWIGTNDGIFRQNLRNPFFKTEDLSLQMPSVVNTGIEGIYTEKENIYLGLRNEGGLLLVNKTTNKIERHIDFQQLSQGCNSINFIIPYRPDTLWLGTGNGIVWLNKKNFSFGKLHNMSGAPDWIYNERCRTYLLDSKGNTWISFGKLNSVIRFNRASNDATEIKSPFLKITFCFGITEDTKGDIWFFGDGACRWNRHKEMVDTLLHIPAPITPQVKFIEVLDADKANNLWLFFDNKIVQYNTLSNEMLQRLPQNNILDGFHVTNSPIIRDHIWICLSNGISAFNTRDYSVKQFNYADGLPNAVVTSIRKGSFYDTASDLFYIGAGQHLISFTPDASLPNIEPIPHFFIELIDSYGKTIPQSEKNIQLPYSRNSVQLRFNAINFTDPEDNRYSYRIINAADTSWQDLNTQSAIGLDNLAPGQYRLQAKLASVNNRWPDQISNLLVTIVPPFWKTPSFLFACFILLATLLFYLYQKRIRQIRQKANIDKLIAQTEMKALHAQMNPHFIFNSLNSIKEMILNNKNREASHYLSKFAHLIRLTLDQSMQPFISLRHTIDYLRRYMEMEQIRNGNFTSSIHTDHRLDLDETVLPPMLIQPLIENAIWHGTSKSLKNIVISIDFIKGESKLVCIVDDNGIGINQSLRNKEKDMSSKNSIGIENIKSRIALLNEKYHLHSSLSIEDKSIRKITGETGTIATLQLPLEISVHE